MDNKKHALSGVEGLKIDSTLQEVWGWKSKVDEEYKRLGWDKFKAKVDKEARKFATKYKIVFN